MTLCPFCYSNQYDSLKLENDGTQDYFTCQNCLRSVFRNGLYGLMTVEKYDKIIKLLKKESGE